MSNKPIKRFVFIGLLIFSALLAACQAFGNQVSPTPTNDALSSINATIAPLDSVLATPIPATEEPIILEGATTTSTGLQYLEEIAGTGTTPKNGDIVTMHFTASLADGTELINTYTDGNPSTTVFGRGNLLPGWEEGLTLMKVGGKCKLVLPAALAFGAEGNGSIPPNSQIVMVVELIDSKPAPKPTDVATDKLITTASGLQYYDMEIGTGDEVTTTNSVTNNYTIWVKGDTENLYIASSETNAPITFIVGKGDVVFPGWEEGVLGMKVGGKRQLIIPSALALGENGGGDIPPNATLLLEIELMDRKEARKATKVDENDFTTTDTGLKFFDIKAGTGDTPQSGQTVVVHYTGWLEDGTQFDSSVDRGETFQFVLGEGNVIPGWDEGVGTMKVGGIRQLVIPSNLAYGAAGSGSVIPPNATLVFEVELIEILP